mgnify:FL=1
MQRVYIASSLSEARLVQQMLLGAGVRAQIFNEHASGALGELAATSVWPEIWIDREQQLDLARDLIAQYESAPDENLTCTNCGEINPATFETCWHCDQRLPVAQ